VTYEMMEAAWRLPARTGARPGWMEPWIRRSAVLDGDRLQPNNGMRRTALRAGADAERWAQAAEEHGGTTSSSPV
jgi:hypothetical protein